MNIDHRQPQTEASASTSAADAASSLRAAALLSRKRRKVAPETPGSSALRPVPEPSFQLDYGQDDTSPPAQVASTQKLATPDPAPVKTSPTPSKELEDIEDGQIREEGEISDTETPPPPPPQRRSPTPPPRTRHRTSTTQSHKSEIGKGEIAPPPQPPPLLDPAMISLSEQSDAYSRQAGDIVPVEPFVLETATYRLDANHVRPGLAMTQDQYNTAKDIVLDLLGWGVPPEHLLECGLSRHVVYYVFTELNLRLPNNLDINGLIPYPTPELLSLMPVSPSLSSRSLQSSSSAMPPPSIIPVRATLAERMSIERIDTDMSSPDPPYVKAEPSSPSAADISSSHSLLMIEQQRRQELLARKAVIASRKARQNDSTASSIVKDQDVDMTSVPSQSVDDFLKSIEPVSHSGGNDGTHVPLAPTSRFLSPENMDVDESIPGLIGTSGDSSTFSAGPSSATSTSSASTITHMEPNSPATLPPGSTTDADSIRSNSTYYAASTASLDVADSYSVVATSSYSSFDGDSGHPQRRGTKRPVAADFVDFDSGPGRGSYTNGYSNGGAYPNPLSRRKTGSFAGISGMRRCVIELSDSEDDGDGEMMGEYGLVNGDGREYSPAVVGSGGSTSTRHPPRLTATPTMSSSFGFANGSAGLATPPSTFASPSTGFGAMSPAALVEKEQEIRKMRQLIAQREELRLKKLAAMSSKLLPTMPAPASSTTVTVKDEEMSVEPSSLLPSQQRASGQNVQSRNSTITHDVSGMADTSSMSPHTTDNSATAPTPDPSGETGDRRDLSATETSTIGHDEISAQDADSEDEQDLIVTGEASSAQVVASSSVELHQESSAAGDSGSSSSAQVSQQPQLHQTSQSQNQASTSSQSARSSFPLYDSPFATYPLLRSRFEPATEASDSSFVAGQLSPELTPVSHAHASASSYAPSVHSSSPTSFTSRTPSFSVSSHASSSPIPFPDLKRLKQAVLHRTLGQLTARNADLRVCQYEVPGGGVCRDNDCDELHLSRIACEPSDTELAAFVHGTLPHPWCGRCDVHAIEIALEGVRLRGGAKDVDTRVREALAGLGIPIA